MIGTLVLTFLACMALASLGLLVLIRLGVIDQQLSLILFIATVPLAGWVALAAEATAAGPARMLPHDEPRKPVEIDRLWPRGSVDSAHRLRPPVGEETTKSPEH